MLIGLLAWLPRGLDLDRLVTPDEPLWLARSANFSKALADHNLDQTYQYAHPGVTVMWAGTLAYLFNAHQYISDGPATIRQSNNRIAAALLDLEISPLETLASARRAIVLFIVATLVLTGRYTMRLFGVGPGLAGIALLATDPFHVALSRLLHLDGLFSSLVGLSAVSWLTYLYRGRRHRDLIIAGIAVGLCGLTRSMAVVLLPMILISAAIEPDSRSAEPATPWNQLWQRTRPVVIAGMVALATFFTLWPAMWTSPVKTTKKFLTVGYELGQRAHARPIFFKGAIFDGTDPGALFYPVSFVWRTTPALLAGLLIAIVALLISMLTLKHPRDTIPVNRPVVHLLILSGTILTVLTLSDKKLDRYIITMVPPLAFVAGWGFGEAARWIAGFSAKTRIRLPFPAAVTSIGALLIGYNLVAIVQNHPYGLSYYNPLLGGAPAARSTMMIGWGEGLDQVSEAIALAPDAEDKRVTTSAWRTPLDYFLQKPAISPFDFETGDALVSWLRSDYYVWYITADQRGYIPPEMQVYFDALQPAMTVDLAGIEYAALYDLSAVPFPPYFTDRAWMTEIAPGLRLVTASLASAPLQSDDPVTAVLFVTGAPTTGDPVTVELTLTGPDGTTIEGEPQSVPVDSGQTVWSIRRRIALPAAPPFGTYWVTARFSAAASTVDVVLGSVTVQDPEITPTPEPVESEPDGEP